MSRRVVVTGLGLVTPIGIGVEEFWGNLLAGRSGVSEITSFDTSGFKSRLGCEIKDFARRCGPFTPAGELAKASQFALVASRMALSDAGLTPGRFTPERMGVVLGASVNELPPHGCNSLATRVAEDCGAAGPVTTVWASCASGNYAVGCAFDALREGRADWMLAGGAESFSKRAFVGFSRLRLISPDACRPFDLNRKGIILGEGAGVLLLESLEAARRRGARVYAEVAGYGLSCDAHHIVSPHPDGGGAALAVRRALQSAGLTPARVNYISAHGNGTPNNDKAETAAIKAVFGSRAYEIPVSSVKALTGHCLAASGAVGAIACALSIERGVIPPTWNLETPDPACDLDYVPNAPREARVRVAINNSYAFGGNNACVVLSQLGHMS